MYSLQTSLRADAPLKIMDLPMPIPALLPFQATLKFRICLSTLSYCKAAATFVLIVVLHYLQKRGGERAGCV